MTGSDWDKDNQKDTEDIDKKDNDSKNDNRNNAN